MSSLASYQILDSILLRIFRCPNDCSVFSHCSHLRYWSDYCLMVSGENLREYFENMNFSSSTVHDDSNYCHDPVSDDPSFFVDCNRNSRHRPCRHWNVPVNGRWMTKGLSAMRIDDLAVLSLNLFDQKLMPFPFVQQLFEREKKYYFFC